MTKSVQISEAVAKALMESGKTAEEVLRQALKVKPEGLTTPQGYTFPEGTAFLVWYKDRPYWGTVRGGAIEIDGERFTSVSAAAAKVTQRPTTNGWEFWQVKLPGKAEFIRINKLIEKEK